MDPGPGEESRDWTGVLDPWSPFEEPFAEATLSGWAARGDDDIWIVESYEPLLLHAWEISVRRVPW